MKNNDMQQQMEDDLYDTIFHFIIYSFPYHVFTSLAIDHRASFSFRIFAIYQWKLM